MLTHVAVILHERLGTWAGQLRPTPRAAGPLVRNAVPRPTSTPRSWGLRALLSSSTSVGTSRLCSTWAAS